MRAIRYQHHGGPDVLRLEEVPDPTPGPRDVVIDVGAAALNRLDLVQRAGYFTMPGFTLPHVPGMDVAGTVVEVGDDVTLVSVGDRVVVDPSMAGVPDGSRLAGRGDLHGELGIIGATEDGGYAERCLVPETHVQPIPDHVSFEDAATFPTCHLTAAHALFDVGGLRAGETLLVHAAASGVSTAAIQLAVQAGVRVLATASTPAKLDWATRMGADEVVEHHAVDVAGWAREVTGGRGVNLVLDHVGTALFGPSLFALGIGGRLVSCGNTSGDEATIPSLGYLFHSEITIRGSGPYLPEEFAPAWERFCTGGFPSVVHDVMPLADAARAHQVMEANEVLGKLVLVP